MPRSDVRKLIRKQEIKDKTAATFLEDSELRTALEKIAEEDNRSVPYVVESIIRDYLRENKTLKDTDEKRRRFARKDAGYACLIGKSHLQARDLIKGTILDISHGGIRISVSKSSEIEINSLCDETFAVIFTLPQCNWPIRLECLSQRIFDYEEELHIGAIISNHDCSVCLALRECISPSPGK